MSVGWRKLCWPCWLWLVSCAGGPQAEDDPVAAAGSPPRSGWAGDDSQRILERFAATNQSLQQGPTAGPAKENTLVNQQFNRAYQSRRDQGPTEAQRTRSFWGRADYPQKVYGGPTDGSRFLRRAREASATARQAGVAHPAAGRVWATDQVVAEAAREAGRAGIDRPADAETAGRRDAFPEPEVMGWRQQRGLTVEDTRAMLGR